MHIVKIDSFLVRDQGIGGSNLSSRILESTRNISFSGTFRNGR